MNDERVSLLKRMDAALERMKADGAESENCPYYQRFRAKRDAIAKGDPYATYNVAPYIIRAVGAQIPNCNVGTNGKSIKARGKWEEVVAPAYFEMEASL